MHYNCNNYFINTTIVALVAFGWDVGRLVSDENPVVVYDASICWDDKIKNSLNSQSISFKK